MHSRGFSLLECLIGLALGMVVLRMGSSVWQTNQQAHASFTAQLNLQHNARVASEAIVTQAELAGSAQWVGAPQTGGVLAVSAPDLSASDHARGGDSLVLSHWRSLDPADCLGNRNGTADTIRNQFQRSTTTPNDFACKDGLSLGGTYQALAEGVEDFQVTLAEVTADSQKLQWKTPAQVTQWDRVVALEVCLRLASPNRVSASRTASTGCQGETVPADGHVRWIARRMIQIGPHQAFNR